MGKIDYPKSSDRQSTIDSPHPNECVYDQCISIAGSIRADERDRASRCIRAYIDSVCIGETHIFTPESTREHRVEYKILARLPEPLTAPRPAIISITLSRHDENAAEKLGEVPVQLLPARLTKRHYGEAVPPDQAKVLRRDNIYGSGPPAEQPSPEAKFDCRCGMWSGRVWPRASERGTLMARLGGERSLPRSPGEARATVSKTERRDAAVSVRGSRI